MKRASAAYALSFAIRDCVDDLAQGFFKPFAPFRVTFQPNHPFESILRFRRSQCDQPVEGLLPSFFVRIIQSFEQERDHRRLAVLPNGLDQQRANRAFPFRSVRGLQERQDRVVELDETKESVAKIS
jgi:hypothetical protein